MRKSADCRQGSFRFIVWLAPGLSAAAAMLAVGNLFNQIESALPGIPAEYASNPAFREWPGWTESYMLAHPVWFGFLFAAGFLVWMRGEAALTWRAAYLTGASYGATLFVVGSLPIFALMYASFSVSAELVSVSWAGRNLSQYVVAGVCVAATVRATRRILRLPKTATKP